MSLLKIILAIAIALAPICVINLVVSGFDCVGTHVILTNAPQPAPVSGTVVIQTPYSTVTETLGNIKTVGIATHYWATNTFTMTGIYTVMAGTVESYTLQNIPYAKLLTCKPTNVFITSLTAKGVSVNDVISVFIYMVLILFVLGIVCLVWKGTRK
jgi:hypothetical protein